MTFFSALKPLKTTIGEGGKTSAMELLAWKGDWGLPSVDHQCLAAMAYCKFADVPVEITKTGNPWKSPSGLLPVLSRGEEKVCRNEAIFDYLRRQQWGTEHVLSSKQSADAVAYIALMEEKLLPALLHLWWVDSKTYSELTRPWYCKALPFPLNMYLPNKTHNDCLNRLRLTQGTASDSEHEAQIYRNAKECLNMLSTKLGNGEVFFGSSVSLLDAVVFGYLSPLLKVPFPSTGLQNHLKACTNLCQHSQGILDKYFPLSQEELEEIKNQEAKQKEEKSSAVDSDFPNKKRNMIVGGVVALTAMVGYAFLSGIVQIDIIPDDAEHRSTDTGEFSRFGLFEDNDEGENEDSRGDSGSDNN